MKERPYMEVKYKYPSKAGRYDCKLRVGSMNPEIIERTINIQQRRQNLNVKLTQEELNKRKGSSQWCQKCLKRRVNKGYTHCMRCN